MKFPVSYYAEWTPYFGLLIAWIIGIGFGFFLERGGFGNARKLAAQFYFKDFAVLKVMFTAIVVAGLGFWGLVLLGLLDLSATYINLTFLGAQVIGGLILGVGFVIGGYCPGTSCVAVSTGKLDALVYLAGILFGIFVYSEFAPILDKLHNSGSMGEVYVWQWLHVSPGVAMILAVLMAVGAFTAATIVERKKKSIVQP
ncbi:MAG: YeeE/YedE thiosulfate transporter family protein [Candidatus Electryonea clarkiae]|nr:YeeE/YedE thiosulfate transporter family protein [Candidatus Electryonea clarkiae]